MCNLSPHFMITVREASERERNGLQLEPFLQNSEFTESIQKLAGGIVGQVSESVEQIRKLMPVVDYSFKIPQERSHLSQIIEREIQQPGLYEAILIEQTQKPMHSSDRALLEHMAEKLDCASAERPVRECEPIIFASDFIFNAVGLFLTYKERRLKSLSSLEMQLCSVLFFEEAGYKFSTLEVSEKVYGEPESSQLDVKFKKMVQRFNNRIEKQTGRKLIQYSIDYVSLRAA